MSSPPSASSSSSVLASLPARPPTPPRDVSADVDDALSFLTHGHMEPQTTKPFVASAATPPRASSRSSQQRESDSTTTKKVGFSLWPTYHGLHEPNQPSSPVNQTIKSTSLVRHVHPLKSILKPSHERAPPTPDDLDTALNTFSPQVPGSFRRLLQSVLLQLASPLRDIRRDAYLAINGTLKSRDVTFDLQAILEKLPLLSQFITRDLACKDLTGQLDTNIVTQASQLTTHLLIHIETARALDDDFGCFVVDRSIYILEQTNIPMAIVKAHLHLLAVQKFSPDVWTATRVDKTVSVLQEVEDRNSILAARLIIYQRLVEQAPAAMLAKMKDWIEHVFHGMLSSVLDLQRRAIETCTVSSLFLGSHHHAGKVIYELCERMVEDDQSYGDFFNLQLIRMTADPEKAEAVPQIWSAVVMFFRSKRRSVERWPKFRNWLLTLQKCLNSTDLAVKQQANISWNKLVFTVMPSSSTAEPMRSMLRVPIVVGLDKRGNDKHSQQLRQIAMDSYCNLLHYALKPALTHEDLDLGWDTYIHPILITMAKGSSRGQHNTCRILHGLLKKTSGVWNENAANEKGAITPDELPRLDVRWIRSRVVRLLAVLEPMLVNGMFLPAESNKAVDGTWGLFMRAIAAAGAQEVKTSGELKDAIAQLVNFFRRLWTAPTKPHPGTDTSAWVSRYQALLDITIGTLGSSHFVEEVLTKTDADEVEAAPTPSQRIVRNVSAACSPFAVLFALFYEHPQSSPEDRTCREAAAALLRLVAGGKASITGTIGLLRASLQPSPGAGSDKPRSVAGQLWCAVADTAMMALRTQCASSPQRDTIMMGAALRSALSLLGDGLIHTTSFAPCLEKVLQLYIILCEVARQTAGSGGVILSVMEPVSKSILAAQDRTTTITRLALMKAVADQGVWLSSRAQLDQSRKALWTISIEPPKAHPFDAFDEFYNATHSMLERGYDELVNSDIATSQRSRQLLLAIVGFAQKCPLPMLLMALCKLQLTFAIWIQDQKRLVFPMTCTAMHEDLLDEQAALSSNVIETWTVLLNLVGHETMQKDSLLLASLEPLLIAGFSSPSKDIANKTITFWNSSFGQQTTLDYPPRILQLLRARQAQTDISLPGFAGTSSDSQLPILPEFAESQTGLVDQRPASFIPRVCLQARKGSSVENMDIKQHSATQGLTSEARDLSALASDGSSHRARPHHDDSQVDFAPIDPVWQPEAAASQALTEHQEEAWERQHDEAQLYPGLSSSPLPQSSLIGRNIKKKLDFETRQSDPPEDGLIFTPLASTEANHMSDDLPSSPTPRAVDLTRGSNDTYECSDLEEFGGDPPSSPPRRAPPNPVDTNDMLEPEDSSSNHSFTHVACEPSSGPQNVSLDAEEDEEDEDVHMLDLPSETQLPNAQLEREAAAAATVAPVTRASMNKTRSQIEPSRPSMVKNSVVKLEEEPPTPSGPARDNPNDITKKAKKRKRSVDRQTASTKRRKSHSPLKSLVSAMIGRKDEADDDMEDEIVVAPRPVTSALKSVNLESPERKRGVSEYDDSVAPDHDVKRRRGRSKKSELHESDKTASPKTGVKQQSSLDLQCLSGVVEPDSQSVKPNRRSVRLSRSQEDDFHMSQENLFNDSLKRRFAAGVMLPASSAPEEAAPMTREDNESSVGGDDSVHNVEQSASGTTKEPLDGEQQVGNRGNDRVIAQPKSILERLCGILSDCTNMILGSQEEERQFDDVLFQLRREVHDAGRRGWSQSQ